MSLSIIAIISLFPAMLAIHNQPASLAARAHNDTASYAVAISKEGGIRSIAGPTLTIAQLLQELSLAKRGFDAQLPDRENLVRRAFDGSTSDCLLSTAWAADNIFFNISMMGTLYATNEIGYYRFLNQTVTWTATLGDILDDVSAPGIDPTNLAIHTSIAAANLNNEALDLFTNYIICGTTPASYRALLARVTADSRDGFWTAYMIKSIGSFGLAYVLSVSQGESNVTSSELRLAACSIAFFSVLGNGIIDRLQETKKLNSIEAFLINAFISVGENAMKAARAAFGNNCFGTETLEPLLPVRRVARTLSDTTDSLRRFSSFPRFYTPPAEFYDACDRLED